MAGVAPVNWPLRSEQTITQARRQNAAYSREAFLEWESRQRERWELFGGRVKMMDGGSADHNVIAGNVFALLHAALRGSSCRVFQQTMKLAPETTDDVMYPDVFVTCRAFGGKAQTLASATVIVEVMSPSSREDDYAAKWESYQRIADLRHSLIVSQDAPDAALYSRLIWPAVPRARAVRGALQQSRFAYPRG